MKGGEKKTRKEEKEKEEEERKSDEKSFRARNVQEGWCR